MKPARPLKARKRTFERVKPLTAAQIHDIRMSRGIEPARVTGLRHDRSQATIDVIQGHGTYRHIPWTDEEREHYDKFPRHGGAMRATHRYRKTGSTEKIKRCPHCGEPLS